MGTRAIQAPTPEVRVPQPTLWIKWLPAALMVGILAILVLVATFQIAALQFYPFTVAEFLQLMTPLIMIALFIERAVEVFLTPLRAPQAAAIVGKAKAIREQSKSADFATELSAAEAEVTAYKCQTQRIAFLTTFLLGVVVSGLGVRAIGMFLDPAAFGALSLTHRQLFVVCDVVVTGALLGGGADALHKLVSVFTDWMDRSRPAKP